jgi:hypothetical protein
MAQVNFYGIQQQIQTQLQSSLASVPNSGVRIEIEPIVTLAEQTLFIGIFLDNSPITLVNIGGLTPHTFRPIFLIECVAWHEDMPTAVQNRDNLMKEVIEVLLLDRTLNGEVLVSEVTNADFQTGRDDNAGLFADAILTFETELRG